MHHSLRSMSSHILIAKVNAEIPINQKSFALSRDYDIPYTDIMIKNAGIKESTVMCCNRRMSIKSKEEMIGTSPSIASATAPTNSRDDLNSVKRRPTVSNNIRYWQRPTMLLVEHAHICSLSWSVTVTVPRTSFPLPNGAM